MDGEDVGESNADDLIHYRSEHPRLVAVECTNTGGTYGGLLVSICNRPVTNGTWSVETTQHNRWMQLSYRESDSSNNWNVPHVLGTNVDKPNGWPYRKEYGHDAKWLSASTDTDMSGTTYFRGNLGE